jgi:hypothetical protein
MAPHPVECQVADAGKWALDWKVAPWPRTPSSAQLLTPESGHSTWAGGQAPAGARDTPTCRATSVKPARR